MGIVRAIGYWFGAVLLAALPVIWVPTGAFNDLTLDALARTPQLVYRDLAVFTMAILGVAIFDAFEAARINRRDGIAVCIVLAFLIFILISFAACLTSYGLSANSKHEIPSRLPDWFFATSLLFAFLAKLSATISDEMR